MMLDLIVPKVEAFLLKAMGEELGHCLARLTAGSCNACNWMASSFNCVYGLRASFGFCGRQPRALSFKLSIYSSMSMYRSAN